MRNLFIVYIFLEIIKDNTKRKGTITLFELNAGASEVQGFESLA